MPNSVLPHPWLRPVDGSSGSPSAKLKALPKQDSDADENTGERSRTSGKGVEPQTRRVLIGEGLWKGHRNGEDRRVTVIGLSQQRLNNNDAGSPTIPRKTQRPAASRLVMPQPGKGPRARGHNSGELTRLAVVQPGTAETPAHTGRDVARRVKDAAGDSPYSERVTALGAEQPSPPGFSPVAVHRGTACGNPAKLQGHSDAADFAQAVNGFKLTCEFVARHPGDTPRLPAGFCLNEPQLVRYQLDAALWDHAREVRNGRRVAFQCKCKGLLLGFACHANEVRRQVLRRCKMLDQPPRRRPGGSKQRKRHRMAAEFD